MLYNLLLVNTTKLSDISVGMSVNIRVLNKNKFSIGKVCEIISKKDDPDGIIVLIDKGLIGNIFSIHDVNRIIEIKERILKNESHTSENKQNFYEPDMREKAIPATVQSFLNADGGYLYIGIFDAGNTPSEKFRGLCDDKEYVKQKLVKSKQLQPHEILTDAKFFDTFQSDIEKTLDKYLISDNPLGPLIDYDFPKIEGVTILEMSIRKSENPVFSKKSEIFDLYQDGKKVGSTNRDIFYFRDGSRKKPIETFQDFFKYLKDKRR